MFRPRSARSSYAFTAAILYTATLASAPLLSAQSLPAPSRTMYKCKVNGTTTYSDTPCLGATKLEVEPTRGVSKLSGKERLGNDVVNERHREMFAEAIRPLSGMDILGRLPLDNERKLAIIPGRCLLIVQVT